MVLNSDDAPRCIVLARCEVVDLGEHILEGHGLTEDASRTGCAGRAKVQLIQLVPDLLAHSFSCNLAPLIEIMLVCFFFG